MKNKSYSLFKNINLKNGIITYNDFNIDPNATFESQKWSYKEDLVQINFGLNYIVDIGWYPEFSPKGLFLVELIKDFDWQSPLFAKKCKEVQDLEKYLQQAIEVADELVHKKRMENK